MMRGSWPKAVAHKIVAFSGVSRGVESLGAGVALGDELPGPVADGPVSLQGTGVSDPATPGRGA
jgi:hypothetical protein